METSPDALPVAELILLNGRKKGKRRPLAGPISIIGSAKGCDIQLDVASVRPIHCVIALGAADGPNLRSWAENDVLVNGEAVLSSPLRDNDILRVGPFDFRLSWTPPLAQAVEPEPAADAESPPEVSVADALTEALQIQQLEDLRRQVAEARAVLRRERSDYEASRAIHLKNLNEGRFDLNERELAVESQRSRLHELRARFIKRWKRHWATRRAHFNAEFNQLADERRHFEEERTNFERDRGALHVNREVENHRLEQARDELQEAQRNARNETARREAALDQRERALADAEARLKADQALLRTDRMRTERHSADLRIEAEGMESRVVNLRAVLLQLDERRQRNVESPAQSAEVPAAAADAVARADDSPSALERLAEQLTDQRFALLEQIDRLAIARESWREEESRVVAEMAELGEQLRRREEQIAENEIAMSFEREQIDREWTSLRDLEERLVVRQARQQSIEADWRSELGRREIDLERRQGEYQRRDRALNALLRRWRERRERELVELHAEHGRCEALRLNWAEQVTASARREVVIDERLRDLAARAEVLEKARQQLIDTSAAPALAQKKIERLARQARSALRRTEERLALSWQAIEAGQGDSTRLARLANERIAQAAAERRESGDRLAELELREHRTGQLALALEETRALWANQRDMFERERGDLRDGIERLAGMLIESSEKPTVSMARAA